MHLGNIGLALLNIVVTCLRKINFFFNIALMLLVWQTLNIEIIANSLYQFIVNKV